MSLHDEQIAILMQRHRSFATQLAMAEVPQEIRWLGPHPTLRVNGIQLCGAVDPEAEAALQAARIPVDAAEAWVYEPAQGHLPRALLRRSALRSLEVVVLAPGVFLAGLGEIDHRDWLTDPRVRLRRAQVDERPRSPWALSPAGLRLVEPQGWLLRDHLVLELVTPFRNTHMKAAGAAELEAALRDNADLLQQAGDVESLFGTRPGIRGIVVASGPSLSTQLPWLKAQAGASLVVAVNSALRPLRMAGILPDVVVAVDSHPSLARHLEVADLPSHIPLVHAVGLARAALLVWYGPRYATRLTLSRYDQLTQPRGRLWCSGTVTHTACDLVRQMGAKELILLGADFGYPEGQTHTPGAPAAASISAESRRLRVRDGRGGEIMTDVSLLSYLRDLDDWLAAHPGFRASKRGRAGASLSHAPWMDDDV